MKLFSYGFNGRTNPAKIFVGHGDDGKTRIYLPGELDPIIVTDSHPVAIEISGNGPGPDVAILVEMKRL